MHQTHYIVLQSICQHYISMLWQPVPNLTSCSASAAGDINIYYIGYVSRNQMKNEQNSDEKTRRIFVTFFLPEPIDIKFNRINSNLTLRERPTALHLRETADFTPRVWISYMKYDIINRL